MTALTLMREIFHLGRSGQATARVGADGRRPRIVALESLRVTEPMSPEQRDRLIREGRIAEMSARQVGL